MLHNKYSGDDQCVTRSRRHRSKSIKSGHTHTILSLNQWSVRRIRLTKRSLSFGVEILFNGGCVQCIRLTKHHFHLKYEICKCCKDYNRGCQIILQNSC